jgi:hypothetical protein
MMGRAIKPPKHGSTFETSDVEIDEGRDVEAPDLLGASRS